LDNRHHRHFAVSTGTHLLRLTCDTADSRARRAIQLAALEFFGSNLHVLALTAAVTNGIYSSNSGVLFAATVSDLRRNPRL